MKLSVLSFGSYKNLKRVKIDFSAHGGVTLLAGCNGMGKSNLLEALTHIFKDARNPQEGSCPVANYSFDFKMEPQGDFSVKRNGLQMQPCRANRVLMSSMRIIVVYSGGADRLRQVCGSNEGIMTGAGNGIYYVQHGDVHAAFLSLCSSKDSRIRKFLAEEIGFRGLKHVSFSLPDTAQVIGAQGVFGVFLNALGDVDDEHCDLDGVAFNGVVRKLGLEQSVFEVFANPLIDDVDIEFTTTRGMSLHLEDLSEGELRMILLHAVYAVLADANSIVLLDEPDDHLHESRKMALLDLFETYAKDGRVTVAATHSPTLINGVDSSRLIGMLPDGRGGIKVSMVSGLPIVNSLLGNRMDIFTSKPLMFFEGKYDIIYLRKAIDYFKGRSGYSDMDIEGRMEFRLLGGTGNSEFIAEEIARTMPNRCVYVCLDSDGAGKKAQQVWVRNGFVDITGCGNLNSAVAKNHRFVFCLPQLKSVRVRMMEDYFMRKTILKIVGKHFVKQGRARFSAMREAVDAVKGTLNKYADTMTKNLKPELHPEDFKGFKPLVDFVYDLSKL